MKKQVKYLQAKETDFDSLAGISDQSSKAEVNES
jgi:hypothetical protein